MKKKTSIVLAIGLAVALSGCGVKSTDQANMSPNTGSTGSGEIATNKSPVPQTGGVSVTIDNSLKGHSEILKVSQDYISQHLAADKVASAQIQALKVESETDSKVTAVVMLKVERKPGAKVDIDQDWHGVFDKTNGQWTVSKLEQWIHNPPTP